MPWTRASGLQTQACGYIRVQKEFLVLLFFSLGYLVFNFKINVNISVNDMYLIDFSWSYFLFVKE